MKHHTRQRSSPGSARCHACCFRRPPTERIVTRSSDDLLSECVRRGAERGTLGSLRSPERTRSRRAFMWEVMFWPIVACVLLPWLLVYLGLHVVQRGIIFIDIAMAQMASLGICVAVLLHLDLESWATFAIALGFTLAGAADFFRYRKTDESGAAGSCHRHFLRCRGRRSDPIAQSRRRRRRRNQEDACRRHICSLVRTTFGNVSRCFCLSEFCTSLCANPFCSFPSIAIALTNKDSKFAGGIFSFTRRSVLS